MRRRTKWIGVGAVCLGLVLVGAGLGILAGQDRTDANQHDLQGSPAEPAEERGPRTAVDPGAQTQSSKVPATPEQQGGGDDPQEAEDPVQPEEPEEPEDPDPVDPQGPDGFSPNPTPKPTPEPGFANPEPEEPEPTPPPGPGDFSS